ncbi:C40 family peptidase [Winogradskyella immobilis]|uniref:C40 family peptidase n=1 Tax=Winogradskyella immobilis TaxID=2816852 RepID=A0ABS8EJZ5_9FLAO|nr:C40 family peptidase [Winogradskyella immobilis]MCC1483187.1 C40 family peptidase [Winogradskyella immobilis]MCG0015282.1 C40 family peptidase [Winogradskyella immobilis]
MKKILRVLIILLALSSCKSARNRSQISTKKTETKTTRAIPRKTAAIIDYAKTFRGTKYKYGGDSKKGMDCSGLIYTSFKAHDISMPRTTKDLVITGDWVDLKKVVPGDLVFFATKKNSRKVNHVGIVTKSYNGDVSFIHASSSKGVIISKLSEKYWYFAFVQARRYL